MGRIHVLAASHGTDDERGQRLIHELRAQLEELARNSGLTELVWHEAYVDVQHPQIPAVLDSLPADEPAVVLPLLVADGVHTTYDIAGAVKARANTTAAAPLGSLPELAHVLARRAQAHLELHSTVVLAAAGTRLETGQQQIGELAKLVSAELGREVQVAYCAGAKPLIQDLLATEIQAPVLVLSALLADGLFQTRLASTGASVITSPLLPDVMIAKCFFVRLQEALKAAC
ncbi:sirohydrochlorin chelatase [Glutamicibacter arilaitensis]|uniref:sirohydrochlorin chelatase n=1 Tax=Glutamicibacter arilaitensis TaxID=256701 RepID=UPI00384E4F73